MGAAFGRPPTSAFQERPEVKRGELGDIGDGHAPLLGLVELRERPPMTEFRVDSTPQMTMARSAAGVLPSTTSLAPKISLPPWDRISRHSRLNGAVGKAK